MNEPRVNIPEWTVSELSAALKKTVEDAYGFVRVRGEITGYRGPHSTGHSYFALKDEGAKIDAVIWKGTYGRIRFKPEEGLEVIAERNTLVIHGRVEPPATRPDYREFELGDYRRAFTLGEDLDTSGVTATLRDGVLRIEIPKSPDAQPKKIPVRTE